MENLPEKKKLNFYKEMFKEKRWGDILVTLGILIVPVLVNGIIQYMVNKSNSEWKLKIENRISQNQSMAVSIGKIENARAENAVEMVKGASMEFNPDDWDYYGYTFDGANKYCSVYNASNYWSIWSKYKVQFSDNELVIRVKMDPRKALKEKRPQTITVSMGDYKRLYSPTEYFRFNIFDSDYRTIRLYGADGRKSLQQDWLPTDPDTTRDMIVTITMRLAGPLSNRLSLTPKIEYTDKEKGSPKTYVPDIVFDVELPITKPDDGVSAQIGIGTSKGDCFDLTSIKVSN